MNKIQLHEIVGYLPWGLKLTYCDGLIIEMNSLHCSFGEIHIGARNNSVYPLYTVKLILRPLSDLTKPCLEGGKIPIYELLGITDEEKNQVEIVFKNAKIKALDRWEVYWFTPEYTKEFVESIPIKTGSWPYSRVKKLYEWKFDTHGLIDKGLAIDVNTLETNPYC